MQLEKSSIEPDDLTVDIEGYVWEVQWNSGKIFRYAPNGKEDKIIDMPIKYPTSCIFGGPKLDCLKELVKLKHYHPLLERYLLLMLELRDFLSQHLGSRSTPPSPTLPDYAADRHLSLLILQYDRPIIAVEPCMQ